nr:la-related protein 6A [Ipomoea batatas]
MEKRKGKGCINLTAGEEHSFGRSGEVDEDRKVAEAERQKDTPLLLSLEMEPEPESDSGSGSRGVPIPITSHTVAATASSPPLDDEDDDHHPDFSPVGSPDFHEDLPQHSDQPHPSSTAALTDDLRLKIIKQANIPPLLSMLKTDVIVTIVEYYFSDENLPTDKFLLKYVTKNEEGYVPLKVIASFRKLKKLTREIPLIVTALKDSSLLVVSSDEKRVKRLNPLPYIEARDPQLCTVLVENLPEDHSVENLRQLFGSAGRIKHISIREPHAERDPKKCTIAEKLLSGKLHALVEFDTVESAEKAVATLNNEQDWRFGLRVKLLKKAANKRGQKKKVWRESDPDRHTCGQASDQAIDEENHHPSEHHGDSHDEEEGDHLSKETIGEHAPRERNGHTGRNRGRGRRPQKRGTNMPVHGMHPSSGHGHGTEPSKPPPGPRMPDGTRGFTMGRGRPLASSPV